MRGSSASTPIAMGIALVLWLLPSVVMSQTVDRDKTNWLLRSSCATYNLNTAPRADASLAKYRIRLAVDYARTRTREGKRIDFDKLQELMENAPHYFDVSHYGYLPQFETINRSLDIGFAAAQLPMMRKGISARGASGEWLWSLFEDPIRSSLTGKASVELSVAMTRLRRSPEEEAQDMRMFLNLAKTDAAMGQAWDMYLADLTKVGKTDTKDTLEEHSPQWRDSVSLNRFVDQQGCFNLQEAEALTAINDTITKLGQTDYEILANCKTIADLEKSVLAFQIDEAKQAAARELAQKDAEKYQAEIAAAESSVYVYSTLLGFANKDLGNQAAAMGNAAITLTQSLERFRNDSDKAHIGTGLATIRLTGDIVGVAMQLFSAFGGASDPDPVSGQLAAISKQIEDLRTQMHARFDQVDAKLDAIYSTLDYTLTKLNWSYEQIHGQLGDILSGLQDVRCTLDQLSSNFWAFERDQYCKDFVESINLAVGYTLHWKTAMRYQDDFVPNLNKFLLWGTWCSWQETLGGPIDRNYADSQIITELAKCPTFTANINYLSQFPAQLGLPPLSGSVSARVPNPEEWTKGAQAYAQMIRENPWYAARIGKGDIESLISKGMEVQTALKRIAYKQDPLSQEWTPDSSLFDRLLDRYSAKQTVLKARVAAIEAGYKTDAFYNPKGFDPWGGASQPVQHQIATITRKDGNPFGTSQTLAIPTNVASGVATPFLIVDWCQNDTVPAGQQFRVCMRDARYVDQEKWPPDYEWYIRAHISFVLDVLYGDNVVTSYSFKSTSWYSWPSSGDPWDVYTSIATYWLPHDGKPGLKAEFESTAVVVQPTNAVVVELATADVEAYLRKVHQRNVYGLVRTDGQISTTIQEMLGLSNLLGCYTQAGLCRTLDANDLFAALVFGYQARTEPQMSGPNEGLPSYSQMLRPYDDAIAAIDANPRQPVGKVDITAVVKAPLAAVRAAFGEVFARLAAGDIVESDPMIESTLLDLRICRDTISMLAWDDYYETHSSETLVVPAAGVLANDEQQQGVDDQGRQAVVLRAQMLTVPAHGKLDLQSDGSFGYTPEDGYVGNDAFTYQATDGIAVSSPATVTIGVLTPAGSVKGKPDGSLVYLAGVVVTAAQSNWFYVERPDRCWGILVSYPQHQIKVGQEVVVLGHLGTNSDAERMIGATSVIAYRYASVAPLCLPLQSLGGERTRSAQANDVGQCGVQGGRGLNNIGLLIRTCGRITQTGSGYVYIDDGSARRDGTMTSGRENVGVRVECDSSGYYQDDFLTVTGISSCFKVASGAVVSQIVACEKPEVVGLLRLAGPIGTVKRVTDNRGVHIESRTVTAVFADSRSFYVEEDNRTSGIMIITSGALPASGDRATISGRLRTSPDGERYVEADHVNTSGTGSIKPLALSIRDIGGGDWHYDSLSGCGQCGVSGCTGLNNIGLLVRTYGVVCGSGPGYFLLENGPGCCVRVSCPGASAPPTVGKHLIVTGVSSCFRSGETIGRLVKTQDRSDIRVVDSTVVSVAAGSSHTVAMKDDGSVWAWGDNSYGQLGDWSTTDRSVPVRASLSASIRAVSASDHTVALAADGSVWAWGANYCGQLGLGVADSNPHPTPTHIPGIANIVAVSAGPGHTLALSNDGAVWAWGRNNYGQLGDGTTQDRYSAVGVSGLTGVVAIAAGRDHSLALRNDGTVWAWGGNYDGQFGNGTTTSSTVPVAILALAGSVSVSAGGSHSVVMKSDGTVWACGYNAYGQLGVGDYGRRLSPARVDGLSDVVSVAAKGDSTVALIRTGAVYAWGDKSFGQLGSDDSWNSRPTLVKGVPEAVAVSTGGRHCVAIRRDYADLWAWGWNRDGQLGDGTSDYVATAAYVAGLPDARSQACGHGHAAVLQPSGKSLTWGRNNYGELGNATTVSQPVPGLLTEPSGGVAIAAGDSFTVAATNDGAVWAWGQNTYGQLGIGYADSSAHSSPVRLTGIGGVVAVSAGEAHVLALRADGTVWAWGYNQRGPLGDGTRLSRYAPVPVVGLSGIAAIAAGGEYGPVGHSVAARADGTVCAWGANFNGQLGDGTTTERLVPVEVPGMTNAVALAAGAYHTVALKGDGTVWAWGSNTSGQLGLGYADSNAHSVPGRVVGIDDVVAVAGGANHTLALRRDGTVWAWGGNLYCQLGLGQADSTPHPTPIQVPGLRNIAALAAAQYNTLARKSDGTLFAWGSDEFGQIGDGHYSKKPWPCPVLGM